MIREATFKDYKRILEISKVENNKLLQITRHPLAMLFFRALGRKTFILEQEDKILGFVMFQKNRVGELLIEPSERRKGYGTALREYSERYILKRYPKMIIYCDREAVQYYTRHGYTFKRISNSMFGQIKLEKNETFNKNIIN